MNYIEVDNQFQAINEEGIKIGFIQFELMADGNYLANGTFVDPKARGGRVAYRLVNLLVDKARKEGKQIAPECWYVKEVFERDLKYSDVWKK